MSTISLPSHGPLDATTSEAAISVLPSVRVLADHAEIVSEGRMRYQRVKELGEGGVGTVDLVYDNDIARSVARKRLKVATRTPANLARFIDEIQAVGSLQHPGIAPIHDVGLDEDGYFFTMKYVEGETLETIIERLRAKNPEHLERFSIEARVGIFLQILRTLHFAHDAGYIHRDVKPANVIVGPFGEVLVMDWGLAKRLKRASNETPSEALDDEDITPVGGSGSEEASTSLSAEIDFRRTVDEDAPRDRPFETRVGTLLGSPGYMSPEQSLGLNDRLDERSDVYSLSVLFFEMLSLRYYLDHHKDVKSVLHAIASEEPVSAIGMHHRYGIPPEYTFFLRKGLEKDPNRRFQSVHQMLKALQRIVDGDVPVQCPCTGIKRASSVYNRFVDRHPIGGVVSALVVSGLSVLGAAELALRILR